MIGSIDIVFAVLSARLQSFSKTFSKNQPPHHDNHLSVLILNLHDHYCLPRKVLSIVIGHISMIKITQPLFCE